MEDALVVHLLGTPLQDVADIIHSAILKWASAKKQRPASCACRTPAEASGRGGIWGDMGTVF